MALSDGHLKIIFQPPAEVMAPQNATLEEEAHGLLFWVSITSVPGEEGWHLDYNRDHELLSTGRKLAHRWSSKYGKGPISTASFVEKTISCLILPSNRSLWLEFSCTEPLSSSWFFNGLGLEWIVWTHRLPCVRTGGTWLYSRNSLRKPSHGFHVNPFPKQRTLPSRFMCALCSQRGRKSPRRSRQCVLTPETQWRRALCLGTLGGMDATSERMCSCVGKGRVIGAGHTPSSCQGFEASLM